MTMTIENERRACCARIAGGLALGALALSLHSAALAQESAAASDSRDGVEDIVVTAQFREMNLQDTPLAITALSGAALEARSLTNIAEVGAYSPNVQLAPSGIGFGNATAAYIRGVGENDFNFAFEPAVGFYIDDVYHSTVYGSVFDLLDLERVEVLRGPQGTLFGKNTIGGAIRIVSRKPTGDGSGTIEAIYGSYDRFEVRGAFDVALVPDKLFMRVSGATKQRDGYVDRLDFACANPALAGNLVPVHSPGSGCKLDTLGGENVQTGRVALRWLPSSDIEVNLIGDYMNDRSEPAASSILAVNENSPNSDPDNPTGYSNLVFVPRYGVRYDNRFVPSNPFVAYGTFDNDILGLRYKPENGVEQWGINGQLNWALDDNLSLRSITAYRKYSGAFSFDGDESPLPGSLQYNELFHRQFSQEVQLLGKALDDRLDWVLGAFYFDSFNRNISLINVQTIAAFGAAGLTFDGDNTSSVQDIAAFAHATYGITDRLNLTAGLRFTHERKNYIINQTYYPSVPPPFRLPLGTGAEVSYERWSPKIGLDYQLSDTIMGYVQYSTGFRAGGVNPRPFTPAQALPFYPEDLQAFEVGLKTELFDRKLRLNLAGFLSQYKDMQFTSIGIDADGVPAGFPQNVGKADISGFEVELDARPIRGLSITGSLGFNAINIKELGAASEVDGGPTLDSRPRGVPKLNVSGGIQYDIDLLRSGKLTPRLDVIYRSKVYNLWSNPDISVSDPYTVFNGRITWTSPDSTWSTSLAVTNIFDKLYYPNKLDYYASSYVSGMPGRPREWSIAVRRNF